MDLLHLITIIIYGGMEFSRSSPYDILHPAVPLKIKNFVWVILLLEIGNNQGENISAGTTGMTYFFNIPSSYKAFLPAQYFLITLF
jgi:hypothetical protein